MAATGLEGAIQQSHDATDKVLKGDPEGFKALASQPSPSLSRSGADQSWHGAGICIGRSASCPVAGIAATVRYRRVSS